MPFYPDFIIGIMTGTSCDGSDLTLTDSSAVKCLANSYKPYHTKLRNQITSLIKNPKLPSEIWQECEADYTAFVANHIKEFCCTHQIKITNCVIGVHGQTIFHRPEEGITSQICDGKMLARMTNTSVICDFRTQDIALGGQGAPLAGLYHHHISQEYAFKRTAWVNIGGISNITITDPCDNPISYDIGPGCCLIDAYYQSKHHGENFDKDDQWALSGQCNHALLRNLHKHPFMEKNWPKSACKSDFDLEWLESISMGINPHDIQCTLVHFSAALINKACQKHHVQQVLLHGGGCKHPLLWQLLSGDTKIETTTKVGIDPDFFEAMLIAWLTKSRYGDEELDTHHFTGGKKHLLGKIFSTHE